MGDEFDAETIGVVGLGYVGLPLAIALANTGYEVIGVDIDDSRVSHLRRGESYLDDVTSEEVERSLDSITPTTQYEKLSSATAVAVCVPTPLDKTDQPNLEYLKDSVERLAPVIPEETIIIVESTVYPGATQELVAPILADHGWDVGEDVFVVFSPERINPGSDTYELTEIPKVLGGITPRCGDRGVAIYETVFDEIVRVESATQAELVKLLENTFRTVNIGLINELATVADELNVDIWNTIDAAATKPFGYMPFYPGPGLGGHCLPIDPMYLSWKAQQNGTEVEFIQLADDINRNMPSYVTDRIIKLLNKENIPIFEANILVLGVAYKQDTSDIRESPALDVISFLETNGANVSYHDPHVPSISVQGDEYVSIDSLKDELAAVDCAVLLTDHTEYDYQLIAKHASLVFDTRNAFKDIDSTNIRVL